MNAPWQRSSTHHSALFGVRAHGPSSEVKHADGVVNGAYDGRQRGGSVEVIKMSEKCISAPL